MTRVRTSAYMAAGATAIFDDPEDGWLLICHESSAERMRSLEERIGEEHFPEALAAIVLAHRAGAIPPEALLDFGDVIDFDQLLRDE